MKNGIFLLCKNYKYILKIPKKF